MIVKPGLRTKSNAKSITIWEIRLNGRLPIFDSKSLTTRIQRCRLKGPNSQRAESYNGTIDRLNLKQCCFTHHTGSRL